MTRLGCALLALGVLTWAGSARAQLAPTPPTKTIKIYNNSAHVMYAALQAPIRFGADVYDLWMQAQLGVTVAEYKVRPFQTTKLYRVWINHDSGGIPAGGSVTLTVPFYTQLQPWTQANSGQVNDQFIDWWNAMRVYIFDGKDAADAAYNYSQDNPPPGVPVRPVLPPYPITPMTGTAVPTCGTGCTLDFRSYYVGFPNGVPGQLVEYTFAAAEGPPTHPAGFDINLETVNYNISAVDSIYLPVAIGASGNSTALNTFLGTIESVTSFRTELNEFTMQGSMWPDYVPAYFLPSNSIIAVPSPNGPPNGITAYPEPQVPSTNVMYAESYRVPAPAPPTLTSDADPPWVKEKTYGQLGDVGQGTLDLWNKCTTGGGTGTTCTQIQGIRNFFAADYKECFGAPPDLNDPNVLHAFVRDVYGWVQFEGCKGSLADKLPGQYPTAIKTFCDLMYNFFTVTDLANVFSPYVKLVHVSLKSNAYAFSIDDEQAFKSLPGTGVIVTIAGKNGLENTTQTELPTQGNYSQFCQSGITRRRP
jgi:hypothetical protein